MKEFFERNKIFIAVIIAGVIIAAAVLIVGRGEVNKRPGEGEEAEPSACLATDNTIVTKVIDGDTIVVEGGYSVRLLGMDTDEAGYPCYNSAKTRLEELVLNKEVRLEKDQTDTDQYKRCLRSVFVGDMNVGLEMVKEGLAVARFYEPDVKYKDEIVAAEKNAIDNKLGCKWSGQGQTAAVPAGESAFANLTKEKTGLDVIFACNAGNYYAKEAIVEGRIASASRSKTNTVFLNFEKAYPNQCFSAVVFSSDQYKFVASPENYYNGKNVRVRGLIKEYQGKPEIIVNNPSQIEVGK